MPENCGLSRVASSNSFIEELKGALLFVQRPLFWRDDNNPPSENYALPLHQAIIPAEIEAMSIAEYQQRFNNWLMLSRRPLSLAAYIFRPLRAVEVAIVQLPAANLHLSASEIIKSASEELAAEPARTAIQIDEIFALLLAFEALELMTARARQARLSSPNS